MRLALEDAVVVLLDLQSSVVGMLPKDDQALLNRNLSVTLEIARGLELPVVVSSNLEDGPIGAVLESIERGNPEAFAARIKRSGAFDAFADPAFAQALQRIGRKTLLLAGFPIDVPVMQTALTAREQGYDVAVMVNCCGSPSPRAIDLSIQRLQQHGALAVMSISAMAELTGGYHTTEGQALMRSVMQHTIFSDAGALD